METKKHKAVILFLDQLPWEKPNEHIIRLIVPGVDDGRAVEFETIIERESREEAQKLFEAVCEKLKEGIEVEKY